MSRTDKTKPLWVRHAEHGPRSVHDHRYGPCDLPPHPARQPAATRCRWEDPGMILFGHTCCAGCHKRGCVKEWQGFVRTGNRKARHSARRAARGYVTGERTD
ncbi:hypothetical protein ACH4FX_14565 [Streptomyces sp. NPDC018019]|uniref:hypothetical protein n=1 Tax=Streptomyces sp. NPDC018019 TaxID=3365030 RepID=UPI0037A79A48